MVEGAEKGETTTGRIYGVWTLVYSMNEEWVAHCLTFNVLSNAKGFEQAIQNLVRDVNDAVMTSWSLGSDPMCRRAPEEFWRQLFEIAREGKVRDVCPPYISLGCALFHEIEGMGTASPRSRPRLFISCP